jgi:hypothetical protein
VRLHSGISVVYRQSLDERPRMSLPRWGRHAQRSGPLNRSLWRKSLSIFNHCSTSCHFGRRRALHRVVLPAAARNGVRVPRRFSAMVRRSVDGPLALCASVSSPS